MSKSITTDANDDVVSVTITPPVATISYGRKVGLPNYSNEEMSIFLQVPLDSFDGNVDFLTIEGQLQPQAAFLKAFVCDQLGVPFETVDGKVVAEVPAEQPKAARGGRKPAASKPASKSVTSDDERDELFARLAGAEAKGDNWKAPDGETIWDNRTGKKNPKAPDFKFADGGQGLWLDKAPAWFSGPGEGVNL